MQYWITAWIISLICFFAAFIIFRRNGLVFWDAVALAAPFFPSPLFAASTTRTSYIYLLDILVPVLIALNIRRAIPPFMLKVGSLLLLGLGIAPLLVTLVFDLENRTRVLFAAANAWRVLGIICLMIIGYTLRLRPTYEDRLPEGSILSVFSWFCMLIAVALILDYAGVINSNVFYYWLGEVTSFSTEDIGQTGTAGLFRGSLGYVGTLGVAALMASRGRVSHDFTAVIGAIAGLVIIILAASKTSLLVAVMMIAVGSLAGLGQGPKKALILIAFFGLAFVFSAEYADLLPQRSTERLLGVLSGKEDSYSTLEDRKERWAESMGTLFDKPSVMLGFGLEYGREVNLGYYHSEYVALLMNGGILPMILYLATVISILTAILRNGGIGQPLTAFAIFTLCGGLIHGVTVNHLCPNVYYVTTSGMAVIGYALGMRPVFHSNADLMEGHLANEEHCDLESR